MIRYELLGPLVVRRNGQPVAVGPARERVLLAVLLVRANQVVGADELVDWLWPRDPPANARAALQTLVWRLRKRLGDGSGLRTHPRGYLLETTGRDLDEFRALVCRADPAPDPRSEADLLRAALARWRGPVLGDVPCERLHRDLLPPLTEELLGVRQRRIDADLAAGRHAALVPELRALVTEHPLREGLWAQLMLALYRDGRQADALAAYQQVSRLLADELGIDPGPQLQDRHREILVGAAPARAGPALARAGPVQANRRFEVDRLIALASVHRRLGRHAEATASLTEAARIAGEIGYHRAEAAARAGLAEPSG